MKKVKWYRYTFSDGYVSIVRGYSKNELLIMERDHGKLILKAFEGWA